MKSTIIKVVVVLVFSGGLFGLFTYINKWFALPDDNSTEEFIERTIEDQLDLPSNSIDLTPG